MAITDKDLAADATVGSYSPTQLFAGDVDVISDDGRVVASGQGVLPKYSVVAVLTSTGKLVKHAPAAADGSQVAVGITTQAVNTTSGDQKVAIYVAGYFNVAALTWAAATSTLALQKAAFARTSINVGAVRL